MGIMALLGVLVFAGAGLIMRQFFTDPETVDGGIVMLRVLALGFPCLGMYLTIENVYSGVGENRPAMFFNLLHAWGLEVPAVFVTVKLLGWGPLAVWWAITLATLVSATAFYLYYRRGRWLDVQV
jgi:Na+-driven multidrug efflux pump